MREILVIDDDRKLARLLDEYLSGFGLKVRSAHTPRDAYRMLAQTLPDIIVLDVMLPEENGFDVLKKIREKFHVPVIMLTARVEVTDRVIGLESGADDYITKPFEPRELVARIESVLRRYDSPGQAERLVFGELVVDFRRMAAFKNGEDIDLTKAEFALLDVFARNAGRTLSREILMEQARGAGWEAFNRSIDVLVSRLRQKLGEDPKRPVYIKTAWGYGYMFIGGEE